MEKITHISGLAIPLSKRDVDTDQIIPAQFLTTVTKQGYGPALFRRLRDDDPHFVFNLPQFHGAKILIAGENFGCGSSREHAVWALMEAGIHAIIAPSFSDIFYSNSAKNGLFLIVQPIDVVEKMLAAAQGADYTLEIDIEKKTLSSSRQEQFHFEIETFRQYCFMNGLSELDYILSHLDEIKRFEEKRKKQSYSTVFNS